MPPVQSFPLQISAARSSFGAVGVTGTRSCAADLAQGAWLGPGHRRPSDAQSGFPMKENPWGLGLRHRRTPAKQQGPGSRGCPVRVRPMESGGQGRKRLALLSRSEARWGCGLLPAERLPLQNAAARRLFQAIGAMGPRRRSAELAQGAWLGPGSRRPWRAQSCFPTKESPWGVGFGHRCSFDEPAGTGSHTLSVPVALLMWRGPGAKTACVAFSIRGALGLWFAARGEFPFAECSCQKMLRAIGATGPRR